MAWPPPRLPPRSATPHPSESSPPPSAPELPAFVDATASAIQAAAAAAAQSTRTPSGEFRISQIRDLLFGDVQQRYEQRLADLERDFAALQTEARSRIDVMESSFVGEVGDAVNALTNKVVEVDKIAREERAAINEKVGQIEGSISLRVDSFASELQSLRADLDALTEGLRVETTDMGNRLAQELRKELGLTVQLRVRDEISRLFLALGEGLKRSIENVAEREAEEPSDAELASEPTAPFAIPTKEQLDAAAENAAPKTVATRVPAASKQAAKMKELEAWAEEFSSGDIKILDPDPELEDATEALEVVSKLPSVESI